ncbi:unnamed protein product [Clonostachys byssicola]|uniref:NmrA-like domain-containing protein n=1 Tax=Clonostachys byssicola TaxID=160290 RepID=A0A9N9U774_9HYPO|nr:unnamed protein product [Clonostachys byssicola]
MQSLTVALIGANGQIGNFILHELLASREAQFHVLAFIRPNSQLKYRGPQENVTVHDTDISKVTADSLAPYFRGADVVVSAVGAELLSRQNVLQDAAAIADVRRFYPSEFGMHSVLRMRTEEATLIHPTWAQKMKCLDEAMKHPAVVSGRMSYTVIGCSDSFDAPGEILLCPWEDPNAMEYNMYAVGDANAKMDFTSMRTTAAYLVASICRPEISENRFLAFSGDFISIAEVADLLRSHSGKKVSVHEIPWEQAEDIIRNPSLAPPELVKASNFPVDFLIALRHVQGSGTMWRAPGQTHNSLFPNVKHQSVVEYFSYLFGKLGDSGP